MRTDIITTISIITTIIIMPIGKHPANAAAKPLVTSVITKFIIATRALMVVSIATFTPRNAPPAAFIVPDAASSPPSLLPVLFDGLGCAGINVFKILPTPNVKRFAVLMLLVVVEKALLRLSELSFLKSFASFAAPPNTLLTDCPALPCSSPLEPPEPPVDDDAYGSVESTAFFVSL